MRARAPRWRFASAGIRAGLRSGNTDGGMAAAFLLLWFATAVCLISGSGPASADAAVRRVQIQGGEATTVHLSATAVATITFHRVIEDNRCPTAVLCAWAKPPVVEISLGQPGQTARRLRVSVPQDWASAVAASGWQLRAARLEPQPREPQDFGKILPLGAYRLTVEARPETN